VGHQLNVPHHLESQPSATCVQPQYDSSNYLRRQ
jgi:hypothetical protein